MQVRSWVKTKVMKKSKTRHKTFLLCYNSEGKGFPKGSAAVLKGKVSWQLRAKEYHDVTPHKRHTTQASNKSLIGKRTGGRMPLLGRHVQRT